MKIRESVVIPITSKKIPSTFHSFEVFSQDEEHLLIEIKSPDGSMPKVPLVRIHSECLTGDVFGSSRCDCGKQLEESIDRIAQVGGFIAYLRQEGRGIGLYSKLDAYKLQDEGMDTFAANRHLGFEEDERSFDMVADMLKLMGADTIHLLSNNQAKVSALEQNGIRVEQRVSTQKYLSQFNEKYLKAKYVQHKHVFGKTVII